MVSWLAAYPLRCRLETGWRLLPPRRVRGWHPEDMTEEQVRELVAAAIREHELRVAAISGVLGSVLLAGSWHALWMLRGWVL